MTLNGYHSANAIMNNNYSMYELTFAQIFPRNFNKTLPNRPYYIITKVEMLQEFWKFFGF